jgi:hypothetical protein
MTNKKQNPGFINRLKEKWGVQSVIQVLLIILVFSLAGSTAVFLRKSFFEFIGITAHTAFWLKTIVYILFLFPTYQALLLIYGALLGQFKFFWAKERKMLLAVKRLVIGQ